LFDFPDNLTHHDKVSQDQLSVKDLVSTSMMFLVHCLVFHGAVLLND